MENGHYLQHGKLSLLYPRLNRIHDSGNKMNYTKDETPIVNVINLDQLFINIIAFILFSFSISYICLLIEISIKPNLTIFKLF